MLYVHNRLSELADQEGQTVAYKHLVSAYSLYAQMCEAKEDYQEAVDYYTKCLEQASATGDKQIEGTSNYRLGVCYKELNV